MLLSVKQTKYGKFQQPKITCLAKGGLRKVKLDSATKRTGMPKRIFFREPYKTVFTLLFRTMLRQSKKSVQANKVRFKTIIFQIT